MTNFGTGPPLIEVCPWLQNDEERWAIILDVAERNSVIEGLPPFTDEMRRRMLEELKALDRSESKPE